MLQMLDSMNIKRLIIRYVVAVGIRSVWLRKTQGSVAFGTKAYIFGVVFFVSKCLLATEEQKNLWNVQFWPESLGAMLEYVAYLPRFQRAQPDHVRVKSSCCCILREVVRLVRPRELVSFDPRHVTRFPPIGKRIWGGKYNKDISLSYYKSQ